MGAALERRLKQQPLKDPVSEGILNLLVTAAVLNEQFDALFGQFGLTSSAFNVLRILRGKPEGQPRGEIARRMVNRAPDITRLIDGLARRGLVRRVRGRADRRLSVTLITPKGAALLARIEPAYADYQRNLAATLSVAEWQQLSRLCERIYEEKQ